MKYLLAISAVVLLCMPVMAQVSVTAVPFLQIEPDSRAAGMGNANVAIADNAYAYFWNPAGLAYQKGNQISLTHSNWLPQFHTDLFYDYLVGKYDVDGIGTFGGGITFLNLGKQEMTDAQGQTLGDFRSYEFAVGVSYGFKVSKNFALGTGIRYIYSDLVPLGTTVGGQPAKNGTSVGVDIAGLYRTNVFHVLNRRALFSAGANLSNIGPAIQYTDNPQKDPLPTELRVGWAYTMDLDQDGYNTITIANDISKVMARRDTSGHTDNILGGIFDSWGPYTRYIGNNQFATLSLLDQLMFSTGLEYWYNNQFALRSGFYYESPNNGGREYLTFGAGLRYNIFGVDFSYIYTIKQDNPLANTIRFSLLLNF